MVETTVAPSISLSRLQPRAVSCVFSGLSVRRHPSSLSSRERRYAIETTFFRHAILESGAVPDGIDRSPPPCPGRLGSTHGASGTPGVSYSSSNSITTRVPLRMAEVIPVRATLEAVNQIEWEEPHGQARASVPDVSWSPSIGLRKSPPVTPSDDASGVEVSRYARSARPTRLSGASGRTALPASGARTARLPRGRNLRLRSVREARRQSTPPPSD